MSRGGDRRIPSALGYEDAKALMADPDAKVREDLARHPDTPPEVLFFLADDDAPEVRRAVASNEKTPRQADLVLTRDKDDPTRCELAEKVAKLTPGFDSDRQSTVYRLTVQVLEVLAEDQLLRVRKILAEALKDVANAPHSVIRQLAQDRELEVAGPVLELSPVLSDKDLLEIIASGPVQGALTAISRRGSLTGDVSDALVGAGMAGHEFDAIASLLSNPSAQIREETLDFIVDQAPKHQRWHEPLTLRPKLSAGMVQRMAQFIAENLLKKLSRRIDLDEATLAAVAKAVEERIAKSTGRENADNGEAGGKNGNKAPDEGEDGEPDWAANDDVAERVDTLHAAGELDESQIKDAILRGDKRFAMLALSKLSGIDSETVGKMVGQRSRKGMVAACWKAKLTPKLAAMMQAQLAGIQPSQVIKPTSDGGFALTEADMEWQLEFFAEGA